MVQQLWTQQWRYNRGGGVPQTHGIGQQTAIRINNFCGPAVKTWSIYSFAEVFYGLVVKTGVYVCKFVSPFSTLIVCLQCFFHLSNALLIPTMLELRLVGGCPSIVGITRIS